MRITSPMDLLNVQTVLGQLSDSRDCLLGISGGVDSMVLLHWIAENRKTLGDRFRVMHVNHGIHPNSASWADHVSNTCDRLGIQCTVAVVSLEGLGNNVEYAARQARYGAFCQSGADTILLAHHANDQCESFMLKLFRGSGVKGLKAMETRSPCWFDPRVAVVRPMLGVSRDQIEEWASIHGIVSVEDPSNADSSYDRNYVRNHIWPVIKSRFDIADVNTVRSINHIAEAWELTTVLADIDIRSCTTQDGSLDWTRVRDLGYLRIKNMILRILDLEGVYGFSVNHVEQFASGIVSADLDSRNELSLRGFVIRKHGKRIFVGRDSKKAA